MTKTMRKSYQLQKSDFNVEKVVGGVEEGKAHTNNNTSSKNAPQMKSAYVSFDNSLTDDD